MADAHIFYDEVRINVAEPGITHVYVLVRAEGDYPHMIPGWYYKAFPSSRPAFDVFQKMWEEDGGVLYWARKAP